MESFKLSAIGIQPDQDPEAVRERLGELINGNFSEIEKIYEYIRKNNVVVLAKNISQKKSDILLKKFNEIGLVCRLDPMQLTLIPIDDTLDQDVAPYQCPACGNRQPPTRDGFDICERCGVVGRNYQYIEYKMALEAERQRLRTVANQKKTEKINKAKERSRRQQKKLQQNLLDQSRRQASWGKIGRGLKSPILMPILGGTILVAIGVGLLVWQLEISDSEGTAGTAGTAGSLQSQINLPSSIEIKTRESEPKQVQAAHNDLDSLLSRALAPEKTRNDSASSLPKALPPEETRNDPDSSLPRALPPEESSSVASSGTVSRLEAEPKLDLRPVHLIDFDKVALDSPIPAKTADTAQAMAVIDRLRLLIVLARYQVETGDPSVAGRSVERASILLEEVKRDNPKTALLDTVNRNRAEILAMIAHRYYQGKEFSLAQTQWHEAISLANGIVAPNDRAQAFASIGRTLQEATPAAAGEYLGRAIDSARAFGDPAIRSITLSSIAYDLTRLGQDQQAKTLFAQAVAAIPMITDIDKRLTTQCIIAKYYAEIGDIAHARKLLQYIPERYKEASISSECDSQQAEIRSIIARNFAKNGDTSSARKEFTTALEQIVQFQDPENRARAMFYLARSLAEVGDIESAKRIVAVALQGSGLSLDGAAQL